MNVPTKEQLADLAETLHVDRDIFLDILTESEIDENNLRRVRIFLLGVLIGISENGGMSDTAVKRAYDTLGFSKEEIAKYQQVAVEFMFKRRY